MVDSVDDFSALWHKLTTTQRRFVVAMQQHPTKKDAAEAIGIAASTAYNWNGEVDAAVDFIRNRTAEATLGILVSQSASAAMVVGKLLTSNDEAIKLRAAQDILDRNLGKATQRQEIDHSGGVTVEYVNDWRKD